MTFVLTVLWLYSYSFVPQENQRSIQFIEYQITKIGFKPLFRSPAPKIKNKKKTLKIFFIELVAIFCLNWLFPFLLTFFVRQLSQHFRELLYIYIYIISWLLLNEKNIILLDKVQESMFSNKLFSIIIL
jgi:hypothetical protein